MSIGTYPVNPLTIGSANFSPYQSAMQNPVIPNYPVIQNQPVASRRKIDCVNGIESAYTFPMGPNESAILVDNLSARIFFVTTDASGYKAVKPFFITADEGTNNSTNAPIEAEGSVVSKDDSAYQELLDRLDNLEKRMDEYEQPVSASQSDRGDAQPNKSNHAGTQSNDRNGQSFKGSNGNAQSNGSK